MYLSSIKKYLDPKWKFCVLKKAVDDIMDDPWCFKETENEAKSCVAAEIAEYGDNPNYQFYYEKL